MALAGAFPRLLGLLGILGVLGLAGGCAATPEEGTPIEPAKHQISDFYEEGESSPADVSDPFEGLNRRIYKFNARFDEFVFLPVVNAYETVLPEIVQIGVSNFFANISNLTTFANEVLQLKLKSAGRTSLRFVANATAGWLGFIDAAGGAGIRKTEEDFGQTLGYWGVGNGPYLVLPVLGPSNLRDAAGYATDTVAFALTDPFKLSSVQSDYPAILAAKVINQRHVQPFRYYETGSPFEYDLLRFLYTEKRRAGIDKE